MSTTKNALITGATGKQGGAAIKALCASAATTNLCIFAVTRSAKSRGALTLATHPSISLVEGDLDN
jgi:uncharacterized protein YbjT (DUF2867 family)